MKLSPPLKIPVMLWRRLFTELRRRSGGHRESGAFLLGGKRKVSKVIYYDDIDPHALDTGIVKINGGAFVLLWDFCAQHGLRVLADVHTHPTEWTGQSYSDRTNPVVAQAGHIAIILPHFASAKRPSLRGAGMYEYLGDHQWRDGLVKLTIL
jgi:hypothetical protein